jgi:hypothetical protein
LDPVQVERDPDYTSSEVTTRQIAMTVQQTPSDVKVKRKNRSLRPRDVRILVDSGSA